MRAQAPLACRERARPAPVRRSAWRTAALPAGVVTGARGQGDGHALPLRDWGRQGGRGAPGRAEGLVESAWCLCRTQARRAQSGLRVPAQFGRIGQLFVSLTEKLTLEDRVLSWCV